MAYEDAVAHVIVDIAHAQVDRVFDYRVDDALRGHVHLGSRVLVPFGPRRIEGYIVGFSENSEYPSLKSILRPLEEYAALLPEQITLAHWMVKRYHCLLVEAIRLMIPTEMRGQRVKEKTMRFARARADREALLEAATSTPERNVRQKRVLEALALRPYIALAELERDAKADISVLRALEKRGYLVIESVEEKRSPYASMEAIDYPKPELTPQQKSVSETICAAMDGQQAHFLLHGITGSGKTEAYFECVEHAMDSGKCAIILVPEISLTPQMVERFRGRFGARSAVMHSRLGAGERFDEWRRIRSGDVQVVIGARSAVFAPLQHLGLVIVDEEHESSYRSESHPRYDAIDIAKERCRNEGATLVLGSATPSVDRYYRYEHGAYKLLEMPQRILDRPMPAVDIVDMRQELVQGNRTIFSGLLYRRMRACLEDGNQMILFLNRRGYYTFVFCRECGYAVTCEHCDVAMTYHLGAQTMRCHYCGSEKEVPKTCPSCGSPYIRHFGIGTQMVEEELHRLFPSVSVLRMDVDTTQGKDAHMKILGAFRRQEAQILVGTQMIAKGLDFPNVTLVGVIAADTMLRLPDYRSTERTFQLLTQVAGRAGREEKAGSVVIQTFMPEHFAVQAASQHDYAAFYKQEIALRRRGLYPPFTVFVRFLFSASKEAESHEACMAFYQRAKEMSSGSAEWKRTCLFFEISPSPYARLRNQYRWQVLSKWLNTAQAQTCIERVIRLFRQGEPYAGVQVQVEINPVNMV